MLKMPVIKYLLELTESEMPELARFDLKGRLASLGPEEAKTLVAEWRTLACRPARFVEYVEVVTAALGCNTALYFHGGGEGAKAAMYYMIKCARPAT